VRRGRGEWTGTGVRTTREESEVRERRKSSQGKQ